MSAGSRERRRASLVRAWRVVHEVIAACNCTPIGPIGVPSSSTGVGFGSLPSTISRHLCTSNVASVCITQRRYSFGFNLFNVIVFSNLKILSSVMASDEVKKCSQEQDLKQRRSYLKLRIFLTQNKFFVGVGHGDNKSQNRSMGYLKNRSTDKHDADITSIITSIITHQRYLPLLFLYLECMDSGNMESNKK